MHVSQSQHRTLCRSQRPDHICSTTVVGPLDPSTALDRRRQTSRFKVRDTVLSGEPGPADVVTSNPSLL